MKQLILFLVVCMLLSSCAFNSNGSSTSESEPSATSRKASETSASKDAEVSVHEESALPKPEPAEENSVSSDSGTALPENPDIQIDINTPPLHVLEHLLQSLEKGDAISNQMLLLEDYCIFISPYSADDACVKYAWLDGSEKGALITSNSNISALQYLGDGQFLLGIWERLLGDIGESYMYYLYQIDLLERESTYIDGLELSDRTEIEWVNGIPYKRSWENSINTITVNPFNKENQSIIENVTYYCVDNGKLYYQNEGYTIVHSFDFSTNRIQDEYTFPAALELKEQSEESPALIAVYDHYLFCMITRGNTQDVQLVDFSNGEILHEYKDVSWTAISANGLYVDDEGFYTSRGVDREPGPFYYHSYEYGKKLLAIGQIIYDIRDNWIYFLANVFYYPDSNFKQEDEFVFGKMRKDGSELTWIA